MAKQDGWKPHEAQLEPLLLIPSGPWAHYRRLQEFVGLAGPRKEVEAIAAAF